MPCSLCGNEGHNRRTCQQWPDLEAVRQAGELGPDPAPRRADLSGETTAVVHTPPAWQPPSHLTNIRFDVTYSEFDIRDGVHSNYTPSTRNRRPVESGINTLLTPIIIPPIPFPDLENIDFDTIFGDDSIPDLELDLDEPVKQNVAALVDCVEEPCVATDCAICMEDLTKTDLFVSRCGHQFHSTCMVVHIRRNDNCPMCRGVLFNGLV